MRRVADKRVCAEVLERRSLLAVTVGSCNFVTAGAAGWVGVSSDSPATDLPRGTRYSYDLNGDGRFEVRSRTAGQCTVAAGYLKTVGAHGITVRVTRPDGTTADYQTTILSTPTGDWFPHADGMVLDYEGTDDGSAATWQVSLSNASGGRVKWVEAEMGSNAMTLEQYLKVSGTRTSLIQERDTDSSGSVVYGFGSGLTWWDFGQGTSWADRPGSVSAEGHRVGLRCGGTITVEGVAPLTLDNGLYFPEALAVKQVDQVVLAVRGYRSELNATTTTWFVRGLGVVREVSDQTTTDTEDGSTTTDTSSYERHLATIPAWMDFSVLDGTTLRVCGTTGADNIRFATDGASLTVYRNGWPMTYDAAQVTGIVVNADAGNDVVDGTGAVVSMTIVGGAGADTITGGAGDDWIDVRDRSLKDVVDGGDGQDTVVGDANEPSLTAEVRYDRKPGAPAGLAIVTSDVAHLTWTAGGQAAMYEIQRSMNGKTFELLGSVDGDVLSYTDSTALAGVRYWYRVCAVNPMGMSGWSGKVAGMTSYYGGSITAVV